MGLKKGNLNGTKRNVSSEHCNTGISDESNCIGHLQTLISKIKSEMNQIQSTKVTDLMESQQNKYAGEKVEGNVKSPGNFETVWISDNTDEIDNLANSFDSDIFNLRT